MLWTIIYLVASWPLILSVASEREFNSAKTLPLYLHHPISLNRPHPTLSMTKHSRNNTASSVFSYNEYKRLDYGTKRQRLGNESMRRFDACSLCCQTAREPVACPHGHLFCKECVYTDLCELLEYCADWAMTGELTRQWDYSVTEDGNEAGERYVGCIAKTGR